MNLLLFFLCGTIRTPQGTRGDIKTKKKKKWHRSSQYIIKLFFFWVRNRKPDLKLDPSSQAIAHFPSDVFFKEVFLKFTVHCEGQKMNKITHFLSLSTADAQG